MTEFKKILVPTDFSTTALAAFRVAVSLARAVGGEVGVVQVARDPLVIVENGQVTQLL